MLNEGRGVHSRMDLDGLRITIEVPAGGTRTGKSKDGKTWERKIKASYGYILGTHSPDGEHLDCWVRRSPKHNAEVYVIHQRTPDGSRFDEDKVMLGYSSQNEAVRAFKAECFKPTQQYGGVSVFTMEHFKVVAYQARRSKAMLASERNYSQFKDEGLLPAGIKSPIQIAQKVSESMSYADHTMINFEDLNAADSALDIAQRNGLDVHKDGHHVFFADEDQLEQYIDIIDHNQMPASLLGDLHHALPESLELTEGAMDDALDSLKGELKSGTDGGALAVEIAKEYGVNPDVLVTAFERRYGNMAEWPAKAEKARTSYLNDKKNKEAHAKQKADAEARAKQEKNASKPTLDNLADALSNTIGDQFPDGDWRDAADRVRRQFRVNPEAWNTQWPRIEKHFLKLHGSPKTRTMDQWMAAAYDDMAGEPGFQGPNPYRESVGEDTTTDDVFFAQQIQEMRKLAGVRSNEVDYQGTPVVHTTKAIVEGINKGYREVLKDHYIAYTRTRRVERLPVTEGMEAALRTVATTAALNPRASGSSVSGAVAIHTGVNHYELSDYILQRTGLTESQFFDVFAEQEVDEKFSKSAHKWVDDRVAELYPTHIKDRGEAFGRAWNEYKSKH